MGATTAQAGISRRLLFLLFLAGLPSLSSSVAAASADAVEICSAEKPLADCAAICGPPGAPDQRYITDAALDCRFDLRRRDWLAAHAVMQDFMEFEDERRGDADPNWPAFYARRNETRDQLVRLGAEGNAAAYFYAGMIWMWEAIEERQPALRRAAILRHAEGFIRGAEMGSLSVLDMMTVFFHARDLWGKELSPDLLACWRAAGNTMTAALHQLAKASPDDPHLQAGRICIEPTLAALRLAVTAPSPALKIDDLRRMLSDAIVVSIDIHARRPGPDAPALNETNFALHSRQECAMPGRGSGMKVFEFADILSSPQPAEPSEAVDLAWRAKVNFVKGDPLDLYFNDPAGGQVLMRYNGASYRAPAETVDWLRRSCA